MNEIIDIRRVVMPDGETLENVIEDLLDRIETLETAAESEG